MKPSWPLFADWYRGLTLAERGSLLMQDIDDGASIHAHDSDVGRRRRQRWRSQSPFDDESIFAQRLASEGLDADLFARIVGASSEGPAVQQPPPPLWVSKLGNAYAQPASTVVETPPGEEMLGFLELVEPLVDQACRRIAAGVADLVESWPALPFDPEIIEDLLLANLADPLLMRLGRTMALELNVARLQGLLQGQSPEERFQSFLEHLRRPENAKAILAEYPVLARQLNLCIDFWADTSLEFLARLCADWTTIRTCFFSGEDPGLLVDLAGGAGDTHRQGRSVMIAEFESGARLVYKPKSLAVDVHFQELLTWLNDRGCQPPLRILTMLDRYEYGWVEHVAYQDCNARHEVQSFYRRLGLYLALLYAINASDFHLENLIAVGDQPVLIDLETLFNPEWEPLDESEAEAVASRAMRHSVLKVAMLPQRLWSVDDYAGIDISGLGGEEGQLSPDRTPQPIDVGTDAMHYIRERIELPGEANRPTLNGVVSSAVDYVEDVVGGFVDMYRLLERHRSDLLAADGPIARFADDEVRVLLRPTRTYDQLLYESFHPDMLRDGLERDRLLDRLWLVVPERAYMAGIVAAEQAELRLGDIPIFVTRPSSLKLWNGVGRQFDSVLTETGMQTARAQIKQLSNRDMQRQVWFIRSSLATLAPVKLDMDVPPTPPTYHLSPTSPVANRSQLLSAARRIADQLMETAMFGSSDVTWIGLQPILGRHWDVAPLGIDLYGGVAGIGLFLAYAGALFDDEQYTDLARRAHHSVSQFISMAGDDLPGIGGYMGWGGLLYMKTHLGALWNDEGILSQAEEMAELFPRFAPEDDAFGVVEGSAGAIASLLAYHHCSSSERVLSAAVACGDRLLAAAQPMDQGIGWVNSRFGSRPLAGFGHGAAGIAWALLKLADACGEDRFRAAALQAIDYERSLFSFDAANWPDLRGSDPATDDENDSTAPRYATAWCHGAAGIGMARLCAMQWIDDAQLREEIDVALHTTLEHGFGQSHALCHGDLGNLELLTQAGLHLDDSRWEVERDRVATMALASIERDGWQCGGPQAVEMPGLMLGLAGIGYGLLRLAAPERVPSVLLLEPPCS